VDVSFHFCFGSLQTKGSLFSQKPKHHHTKHREHKKHTKKTYTVVVEEELPDGVTKEELLKELNKEQKKEDKHVTSDNEKVCVFHFY
jgi:hypothetical protein